MGRGEGMGCAEGAGATLHQGAHRPGHERGVLPRRQTHRVGERRPDGEGVGCADGAAVPHPQGAHRPGHEPGGLLRLALGVAPSAWGLGNVAGSWGETVKVWDAQAGQETLTLKGHTSYVHSVAFSPDGKRIASGSSDKTVKVWEAQTGQELLSL